MVRPHGYHGIPAPTELFNMSLNRIILLTNHGANESTSSILPDTCYNNIRVQILPVDYCAGESEKSHNFRLSIIKTLKYIYDIKIDLPDMIIQDAKEYRFLSTINNKLALEALRGSKIRTNLLIDDLQSFMVPAISKLIKFQYLGLFIVTKFHPSTYMRWDLLRRFCLTLDSTYMYKPTRELQIHNEDPVHIINFTKYTIYELVTFHCIMNVIETLPKHAEWKPIKVRIVYDYMDKNSTKIPYAHIVVDGDLNPVLTTLHRKRVIRLDRNAKEDSLNPAPLNWTIRVPLLYLQENYRLGNYLKIFTRAGHVLDIPFRSKFKRNLHNGLKVKQSFEYKKEEEHDSQILLALLTHAQSVARLVNLEDEEVLQLSVSEICINLLNGILKMGIQVEFLSIEGFFKKMATLSGHILEYDASNYSVYFLPDLDSHIKYIKEQIGEPPSESEFHSPFKALLTQEIQTTKFRTNLVKGVAAREIFKDSLEKKQIGRRTIRYLQFIVDNLKNSMKGGMGSILGHEVFKLSIAELNDNLGSLRRMDLYEKYLGSTFVRTDDFISYLQELVPVLEYDTIRCHVILLPDIMEIPLDDPEHEELRESEQVSSRLDQFNIDEDSFEKYLLYQDKDVLS